MGAARICGTSALSDGSGDGAELEWSMVTIWPWRDVNELSFLQYVDQVPLAFRYDASLARMQFDGCIRFGLPSDPEASRNYVEYFVPIWMNFASVRCVILNHDDSHGHTIDSGRWASPVGSGGYGEVTVNVEQVTRNIDRDNSGYQAVLPSQCWMPLAARRHCKSTGKAAACRRVRSNAGLGGMRRCVVQDDEIDDAKSQDSGNS